MLKKVNKDEIYKVFPYGKVIPEIIDGYFILS